MLTPCHQTTRLMTSRTALGAISTWWPYSGTRPLCKIVRAHNRLAVKLVSLCTRLAGKTARLPDSTWHGRALPSHNYTPRRSVHGIMSDSAPRSVLQLRSRAFINFAKEHPTVVSAGPASLVSTIASFPVRRLVRCLQPARQH